MAFLASGSDPTVMHCCKIANGKEQVVSRFLHRSPTWFLVLSHTGDVHHTGADPDFSEGRRHCRCTTDERAFAHAQTRAQRARHSPVVRETAKGSVL